MLLIRFCSLYISLHELFHQVITPSEVSVILPSDTPCLAETAYLLTMYVCMALVTQCLKVLRIIRKPFVLSH